MKLAIVIPGFQADEHDWCIPAFTNLARELSKSVELHVFALRYPAVHRTYTIGEVRVHVLGGGAFGGRRVLGASLLNLWRQAHMEMRAEHRRAPFAALIGIWATESGWIATRAARSLGVPCLVHLAGGELTWIPPIRYGNHGRGLARWLVSRTLRAADLLTVPSGPMETQLLQSGEVEQRRVRRWPLGVDIEMFRSASEAKSGDGAPFTFVTAGSLIPVKGYELLLGGLAHLRQLAPGIAARLDIAGTGPLLPYLRRMAADLNLTGYVNFLGEVPHDRLPRLYRSADCFVIGSWHEAQCMAALEAMACGLPWVGLGVGALADVARASTQSGIIVRERTPESMGEAMHRIMTMSPEERVVWAAEARTVVERDYSLVKQSARLLELVGFPPEGTHRG